MLMDSRYDVIISGAGPSGSLLGYLLAGRGINTLILEKQEFPRHKICAGGLQHRSLALIPFDISKVVHKSLHGILFSYRKRDVFSRKYMLPILHTVQRSEFDAFLAKKALDKGCSINFGETVTGYAPGKDIIRVDTAQRSYEARVLAGADGIRGAVHRLLTSGSSIMRILGYETERTSGPEEEKKYYDAAGLDFGGIKNGYVWAFPRKKIISYGIGAPFSTARAMKSYFHAYMNGKSNENMTDIKAQSIPVRTEDTPVCSYRVLAVGDAACLGDGFTGEGIYNSLKSSHMAAESIDNALRTSRFDFPDYRQRIWEDIYEDIKISLRFSKVFFSFPIFFYKLFRTDERFFRLCCRVLRGEKKYRDISGRLNLFG